MSLSGYPAMSDSHDAGSVIRFFGTHTLQLAARAANLLGNNAAAEHALAVAHAAAGDTDSADHSFRRASEAYEARGQWRQAAAVAHDWGSALRQARRPEQALDAFSRAAVLAARHSSGKRRTSASR